MVHADDVAAAVDIVLQQRAGGAFNLAADPPLTRDIIAGVLGARPLLRPRSVADNLRRAVTQGPVFSRKRP